MTGRAAFGTSGFAYPSWRGRFYPESTPQAKMLPAYAARLASVEINYTFNRFPSERLLTAWASRTPEDFTFALKAPRRITHDLRLRDAGDLFRSFLSVANTLGGRLGPVLLQLPPSFRADPALLESFLSVSKPNARLAVEFRHDSWNTAAISDLLATHAVARCSADTDDSAASAPEPANGFVYVRLRRTAYTEEALTKWAAIFRDRLASGVDVFCYLRHDDDARGADAALRLRELVAGRSDEVG